MTSPLDHHALNAAKLEHWSERCAAAESRVAALVGAMRKVREWAKPHSIVAVIDKALAAADSPQPAPVTREQVEREVADWLDLHPHWRLAAHRIRTGAYRLPEAAAEGSDAPPRASAGPPRPTACFAGGTPLRRVIVRDAPPRASAEPPGPCRVAGDGQHDPGLSPGSPTGVDCCKCGDVLPADHPMPSEPPAASVCRGCDKPDDDCVCGPAEEDEPDQTGVPDGYEVQAVFNNLWAWGVNITPRLDGLRAEWQECETREEAIAACKAHRDRILAARPAPVPAVDLTEEERTETLVKLMRAALGATEGNNG